MENSDLLLDIKNKYSSMSKGQKSIANFIINEYDKAAFMTAGNLGKTVGVSESTVVRFACALGFDGYPKLQKHLQAIIKNKLTNVQKLNLMEGYDSEKILDIVLKQDIANLRNTRETLDVNLIEDVVDCMLSAKNLYVIGLRSSAPLVNFFVYYLGYILDNLRPVSQITSDIFAQLVHVKKDDVVIGIGFPRYSSQTVRGVDFAKSRGAKIISITDNKLSPLYELADLSILAKSDMNSFVDSFVAPLSIINAIIIMLGIKRKEQLLTNFAIMEKKWHDYSIYAREDMLQNQTEIEQ